jgi:undecaprenyl pyrophosphate phosphatase UppP
MLASLLASLASGETVVAIRRARRTAIVYLVVGLLALCGVGFLIGALYIWMAARYGRLETALAFGVGFIVLALLVLLVDRFTAKSRAKRAAERRRSDLTAVGVATALAVLPTLLRSRAGVGGLLAPAIALAAYAIWRENTKSPEPGSDPPVE